MTDKLNFDFLNVPSYNWTELHYLTYELNISLSSIKESISNNTQLIRGKRQELKDAIEKDEYLNSYEKEEFKAQYYNQHFEHAEKSINDLENTLHHSCILTIFSVFEGKMKYLCELIEDETKSKVKHTDLKSNGDFGQFIKYLTSVFGMTPTKSESYSQTISNYKTVRNKIAHQNNKISSSELKRIRTLENIRIESYSDSHKILISSSAFLIQLTETVDKYYQELVKEVDERMKELM